MWIVYAGLWRRLRPIFLLVMVGTAGAYALVWLADMQGLRPRGRDDSGDFMIAFLIIGVSGLVGAAGVLLANSDAEKLELALPQRVLRMPMRTWKLVLVHVVFGIDVAAIIALVATLPAFWTLRVDFAWWMPAMVAAALMPLIQLWAYAVGNAGLRVGLVSFVLYFGGLAWLAQRQFFTELLASGGLAKNAALLALFWAGVFALLWAVAVVQRRGGWAASLPRRAVVVAAVRPKRPFRSSTATQFWFEWRQYGMLLPAYVGGTAAAYFVGMPLVVGVFRMTNVTGKSSSEPLFRIDWFSSAQYIWMGLFLSAFIGSLLVGGVMFMRGGHWNSASNYLLTRPLTLSRISNARMLVLGTGAVLALGELVAATAAIEGLVRMYGDSTGFGGFLHQGYELLPMWFTVALHFGFLFVLMWACAWPVSFVFAIGGFAVLTLPMLGGVWGAALLGGIDADRAKSILAEWGPIANWISATLVVFGLLALAWAANRRRFVHPIIPWLCAVIWFAYSWAFAHFMSQWVVPQGIQEWYVRFPHPINWPLWAGISVVPLLPFFLHPLMLARIRNR